MPVNDPIFDQVAARIRARAGRGAEQPPATIYDWAKRYRRLDRRVFTLDNYKPLRAVYEDNWPHIVVMKPAQRGVSEYWICLACFGLEHGDRVWGPLDYVCGACGRTGKSSTCVRCGNDGTTPTPVKSGINVLIVFPARGDLIDFSKERLSNLKDESMHLAVMFGGDQEFDALGFKQVGESFLYLRGGNSAAGLRSLPADLLILDEFDLLDPSAVALARRRLNGSLIQRELDVSTPSIPGKGISLAYELSDQRVWQTPCGACGHMNTYDFFRDVRCDGQPWEEWQKWSQQHVATGAIELHCPVCDAAQSTEDRCAWGQWVSLQPEVTRTHGYHIPWWAFDLISLEKLAGSAVSPDPTEQEEFYHSDLGLPHGVGGGEINEEMLAQLSALLPDGLPDGPWHDTTMGVDVGAQLHYRVSSIGPEGAVYVRAMGSVLEWAELDHLMLRYQVRMCVIDAEPELHESIRFCDKWKGRSMRAFYPTSANALKGVMHFVKKGTYDVQVNRVMAMDYVYSLVAGAAERWPREITNDPDIVAHMKAPTRIRVTDDKTGQQSYAWVHTMPDHGFHSAVYDRIARSVLPKFKSFTPAVGGTRSLVEDYQQRVASGELGPRLSSIR